MPDVHFTNLLIVVAIGLLAPLALGFFPRLRLPAIVLEIVLGIVIGPSGLGWVKPDLPVSILALVGLAFLLFLSGLEIDVQRLRGRILKLTALGFVVSFVIAIVVGLGLNAAGFVKSPLFVAIVLIATSLGVIVPVLKDSNNISSSFGQLVIAAASIADFGAIILLSLFFSGKGSTSLAGTLILLGVFGLVVVLVGCAIAGFEHSMSLSRVLQRLQDTTAQIRVRAAVVLLIGFTALAQSVGLETILGAFAAGALLALIDRDETMTHPQFRLKLEAVGFGVFIPIFFVTSGLRFDLNALFASASTVARVPLFLLAIYLARGLPAFVYVRLLGRSRAVIAGVLQATSLPFIVAATQIGLQLGVVSRASAAGLVAAGLLSVVISPALGLVLLRRLEPEAATRNDTPSRPVMPVATAEDRALFQVGPAMPDRMSFFTHAGRTTMRILLLTAATLAIVGSIAGCGGAGSTTSAPADDGGRRCLPRGHDFPPKGSRRSRHDRRAGLRRPTSLRHDSRLLPSSSNGDSAGRRSRAVATIEGCGIGKEAHAGVQHRVSTAAEATAV